MREQTHSLLEKLQENVGSKQSDLNCVDLLKQAQDRSDDMLRKAEEIENKLKKYMI